MEFGRDEDEDVKSKSLETFRISVIIGNDISGLKIV
jgi:hypothetical protein